MVSTVEDKIPIPLKSSHGGRVIMKFLLMKILVGEEFQWNHGVPYASFKYKDDFVDAVNLSLTGTTFNKAELLSLESSIPWLNKINCIVYVHYKSRTVALQIFTKI